MNKTKKKSTFNVKQSKQLTGTSSSPIVTISTTSLELANAIENRSTKTISTIDIDTDENMNTIMQTRKKSCWEKLEDFTKLYLSLLKLVFQSIIPDIKSFKWWQAVLLLLFAIFNVVFSVLDFNSFLPYKNKSSILKWTNDLRDGVALWRRILLCLSGVAAFLNVLFVVLVIRGKMSSYFWGIIAAIIYGAFAFAYGYVGDAQLYALFFLPMQFIGIYLWSKELDNGSTTRVKSLKLYGWIFVIVLCLALGVLFFYEIPAFSKLLTKQYFFDNMLLPRILDASTNSISVVAQFLLMFCYWEQYILWLIVNTIGILMYSGLIRTDLDINILAVWIMLTINSCVGLYTWFTRWRNSNKTTRF